MGLFKYTGFVLHAPHRKAQALVNTLYQRFAEEDARFRFSNIQNLAADSGPYTLSVLVQLGVIQVAQPPAKDAPVDEGMECALRAAVVVACHTIAARSEGRASPSMLGGVLFRKYEQDPAARAPWRMMREDQVAW